MKRMLTWLAALGVSAGGATTVVSCTSVDSKWELTTAEQYAIEVQRLGIIAIEVDQNTYGEILTTVRTKLTSMKAFAGEDPTSVISLSEGHDVDAEVNGTLSILFTITPKDGSSSDVYLKVSVKS